MSISALIRRWLTYAPPDHIDQRSVGDAPIQIGRLGRGRVNVTHIQTLNLIQHATAHKPRRSQRPEVANVMRLLRELDQHGKRNVVLDYMEKEFGVRLVKRLRPRELKQIHAYAQSILRGAKKQPQPTTYSKWMPLI